MNEDEVIRQLRERLKQTTDLVLDLSEQTADLMTRARFLAVVVGVKKILPSQRFPMGDSVLGTEGTVYENVTGVIVHGLSADGSIYVKFENGMQRWVYVWDVSRDEPLFDPEVRTIIPYNSSVTISFDGKLASVELPDEYQYTIHVGVTVEVNENLQIVKLTKTDLSGPIAMYVGKADNMAEVILNGEKKVVFFGPYFPNTLRAGDRVILDSSEQVIVKSLGHEQNMYAVENVNVPWEDVGGLKEAKRLLREAIEEPFESSDLYSQYGQRSQRGALLYGPPGCGKTLLAKAVATAVHKMSGLSSSEKAPFLYVKGPQILDKWLGNPEASIRSIFAYAREYHERFGISPVVCIDEAEALFLKRGSGISSDANNSIVAQALAEMDGAEGSPAFVMLLTNRPDLIDPAILRYGRLDMLIEVSRPDEEATLEIFDIHLKKTRLCKAGSSELALAATKRLFDPSWTILFADHNITLGQMVYGGMVEAIVNKAIMRAISRDKESGVRIASGVNENDLNDGISATYIEVDKLFRVMKDSIVEQNWDVR